MNCVKDFFEMTPEDLLNWCAKERKARGWTRQDLSDRCGVPVSTMNRILQHRAMEFRYSTIRPIVLALLTDQDECPMKHEKTAEEEIRDLRREKNVLLGIVVMCIVVIATALIFDRINGDVGFFWRN